MKPAPEKAPDAAEVAAREAETLMTIAARDLLRTYARAYARDEFKKLAEEYREKALNAELGAKNHPQDVQIQRAYVAEMDTWLSAAEMAEKRAAGK